MCAPTSQLATLLANKILNQSDLMFLIVKDALYIFTYGLNPICLEDMTGVV